ncbi:hypothetical protein R2537_007082 [Pseudomonas aeruginosa]|nr:hypothetical protein [Pseudomonas aeruginosa]
MRLLAPLAVSVLLTACATPPGQLTDQDFDWSTNELSISPNQVFSGLQEYARTCGGILSQAPTWYATPDGNGSKVDLFTRGIAGTTDFVFGVIELSRGPQGGTTVRTGVQTIYSKPAFRKRGWWVEKTNAMYDEIDRGSKPSCP